MRVLSSRPRFVAYSGAPACFLKCAQAGHARSFGAHSAPCRCFPAACCYVPAQRYRQLVTVSRNLQASNPCACMRAAQAGFYLE